MARQAADGSRHRSRHFGPVKSALCLAGEPLKGRQTDEQTSDKGDYGRLNELTNGLAGASHIVAVPYAKLESSLYANCLGKV